MKNALSNVIGTAQRERSVASLHIESGMVLLAYPMENDLIIGLGFERDRAHEVRTDTVLSRRAQNISRYGAWLPAMFKDGSWFLLRRIADPAPDHGALTPDDLCIAQELLC